MPGISTVTSHYSFPETGDLYFVTGAEDRDPYAEFIRDGFDIRGHVRFAIERLGGGGKFIDVGANIGEFTVPVGRCGARVLAVEALPKNYFLLSKAIQANKFRNVVAVHAAAAAHGGVASVAGTSAWAHLSEGNGGAGEQGMEVPCFQIDELAEIYDFSDARLVKIDVEGAEMLVLSGMSRLTQDRDLEIIVEENTWTTATSKYPLRGVLKYLQGLGFSLYMFHDSVLVPRKPTGFQERVCVDYLATRKPLGNRVGSFDVRQLGDEERVKIVLDELNSGNASYQAYICAFIHTAPGCIRDNPAVREVVDRILLSGGEDFKACLAVLKDYALHNPDRPNSIFEAVRSIGRRLIGR